MTLRVLVDIGHPAHVHFFKHILWRIKEIGGEYCITTRQKDVATNLLEAYGFEYEVIGRYSNRKEAATSLITTNYKLLKIAHSFNPHVLMGIAALHSTHVAFLMNRIAMAFDDTDHKGFEYSLSLPFVTKFYTPKAFRRNLSRKQVFYNGFHEMAYLSPKYFTPDSRVLSKYGLSPDDIYFIIRKVNRFASHDVGQKGISGLRAIINHLCDYGRVYVTAESSLDNDLEEFRAPFAPEDLHSVLSYSRMFIGESATMTSESVALGIPAIFVSSQLCGTTQEQIGAGLVYYVDPYSDTLRKTLATIDLVMEQPFDAHQERARAFVGDKIDVVDFVIRKILELTQKKYQD